VDGAVIVSSVSEPSMLVGAHGGDCVTYWKCFARGSAFRGDLEAWEYAAIPPGGLSGEHLHTRTDEVYFILNGHGDAILNGKRRRVAPGDVILTPLGARHALINVGDTILEWLTIEMTHPETTRILQSFDSVEVGEGEQHGA
jgi:mannose-6-phosphate isomerase-like protein (cupin superfamily)